MTIPDLTPFLALAAAFAVLATVLSLRVSLGRTKAGGVPDLPPDVEGRVLLWSSPAVLVEDPPQMLNPRTPPDLERIIYRCITVPTYGLVELKTDLEEFIGRA